MAGRAILGADMNVADATDASSARKLESNRSAEGRSSSGPLARGFGRSPPVSNLEGP